MAFPGGWLGGVPTSVTQTKSFLSPMAQCQCHHYQGSLGLPGCQLCWHIDKGALTLCHSTTNTGHPAHCSECVAYICKYTRPMPCPHSVFNSGGRKQVTEVKLYQNYWKLPSTMEKNNPPTPVKGIRSVGVRLWLFFKGGGGIMEGFMENTSKGLPGVTGALMWSRR